MKTWQTLRAALCAAVADVLVTMAAVPTLVLAASAAAAAPRDRTPPTTPAHLRVTGASDYSVTLSWDGSTDNSGSWYYEVVSSAGVTASVGRTQTSHTFTAGHAAGSAYTFHVVAVDGSRNRSASSNTVSATLRPAGTAPSAPALAAGDVGPTHISLEWTAPADAGPPVRYWVY